MNAVETLRSGSLTLRRLTAADLAPLLAVLREPTVARWWGHYDIARVEQEFPEDDDTVVLMIHVEGEVAGFIQYSEEDDPDYRHASIDIALKGEFQGRGLGPDAIRTLAAHLFDARGHHRITIDPAAANTNAIRAYESVGFRPVGVMRQYERGPDGTWHDGLLMDLLRDELQ
jgi:aminoglycoside 6'-N-acetyltransferase